MASLAVSGRAQAERLWHFWREVCAAASVTGTEAEVQVTWRLPNERTDSIDRLTVRVLDGRIDALQSATPSSPVWLDEDMVGIAADGATVLAAATHPAGLAQGWLGSAEEASRIVGRAALGPAARSWDGVLRVVLPGQQVGFARLTGLSAEAAAATQAATILTAADSVPRVIVNPLWAAEMSTPSRRRPLLVHEGVHQAVVSALSTSPLWLTEGLAESIAAQADPVTRRTNLELVRTASQPTALPSVADLNGQDALRAYALAATAVDAAVGRWGRPSVMRWLADWGEADRPNEAELTSVYLAAWAALA